MFDFIVKIVRTLTAKRGTEEPVDDFAAWIEDNKNGEGYEVIEGACVPYYDGDFDYVDKKQGLRSGKKDIERCVNAIRDIFPSGDLKVFTANGMKNTKGGEQVWRNSIHIVVRGAGYFTAARYVPLVEFMDANVYHSYQKFRLPYMNKRGEIRPFVRVLPKNGKWVPIFKPEDTHEDPNEWLCSNVSNEKQLNMAPLEKRRMEKTTDTAKSYFDKARQAMPKVLDSCEYRETNVNEDGLLIINTTRTNASECFNSKCSTHDNDNTVVLTVNEKQNKIFVACLRYPKELKEVCLCVEPSYLEKALSMVNVLVMLPVVNKMRMMRKISNVKTLGGAWWLANPFHKKDALNPKGKPHMLPVYQSHSQYCADIEKLVADINDPQINLVCIKAAMGTGKTHLMIEALGKMINEKPDMFIVNSTFRISLAGYLEKEYKKLGFVSYLNKDDVKTHKIKNSIKRIILQLDSFNRLDWKKVNPDIVIIDELHQQRFHFGSDTYLKSKNRNMNRARFEWVVRSAKKVIVMDAGLTIQDVDFIKRIMSDGDKPIKCVVHWNTYKPMKEQQKDVLLTDNKFLVLNSIKHALQSKKKCFLASNLGKLKVMAIGAYLRKSCPDKKILVICSLTQNSPAVKLALADPNAEFGKYDCIVCSPSLQSGVSYSKRDFDACYGIFDNRTTQSSDALQQLRRIRTFNDPLYLVSLNQSNTRPFKDVGRMVEEKKLLWKHLYFECEALTTYCDVRCDEDGFDIVVQDEFMRQILRNREEADIDRVNFARNFAFHAYQEGFNIIEYKHNMTKEQEVELTKTLKQALKTCADENQDAINEAVAKAELVSNEVMVDLKKRMDTGVLTEAEKVQFDKKVLNQYYGVNVETDKEWVDVYNVPKIKTHFTNQKRMAKMATMGESLVDLERAEKNYIEKDREAECGRTAECMRVLSYKPKHAIFNFIHIAILKVFGFDGLWDVSQKTEEQVKASAQVFKNTYLTEDQLKNTVYICDKNLWKVKKTETHTAIMQFVNSVLRVEFGVSITKAKMGGNKNGEYILKNEYITEKMFVNKWLVPEGLGDTIPTYGGLTVFTDAIEEVEYEDEDDDEQEQEDMDANIFTADEIKNMMTPTRQEM